MAVPTGAASMSDLRSEFGLSGQVSMSDFYGKARGAPTSGQVSIDDFRGKKIWIQATLSGDTTNVDLKSWVESNTSWDGTDAEIDVTISSGTDIGSTSTGSYAMVISGFPSNVDLKVINNGSIRGAGGNGGQSGWRTGYGGNSSYRPPDAGSDGGHALYVRDPVTFDNNGNIWAGGGGGGGGAGCYYTGGTVIGGGGGGGAGYTNPGDGGSVDPGSNNAEGSPGGNGAYTVGGGGGSGASDLIYDSIVTGGYGGDGGDVGQNGGSDSRGGGTWSDTAWGTYTGKESHPPPDNAPGGTRGYYLNGSSYVTWQSTGDRRGRVT